MKIEVQTKGEKECRREGSKEWGSQKEERKGEKDGGTEEEGQNLGLKIHP